MGTLKNKIVSNKPFLTVFLLIVSLYLLSFNGMLGNFDTGETILSTKKALNDPDFTISPFESSRMRANYTLMVNFAAHRNIQLRDDLGVATIPDAGILNKKFYSWALPGFPLSAIPFYLLGYQFNLGQISAFLFVMMIALINISLFYYISRRIFGLSEFQSLTTISIFSIATSMWIYSITFMQHQFIVLFTFLIFILVWKLKFTESYKKKYLLGASIWSIYGLSAFFDYPNLIVLSPLILYMLIVYIKKDDKKIFIKTAVYAIILFALLALYNQQVYGNWMQFANTLPSYHDYIANIGNIEALQERNNSLFNTFKITNVSSGIYKQFFSPKTGLLFFSPILIFALFGFGYKRKRFSLEQVIILLVLVANILIHASFGDPIGGWVFGSRYLLPTMAILSLFVGFSFRYIQNKWYKLIIFAVTFYSTMNISAGALTRYTIPSDAQTFHYGIKNLKFIEIGASSNTIQRLLNEFISLKTYYIFVLLIILATLVFIYKQSAKKN